MADIALYRTDQAPARLGFVRRISFIEGLYLNRVSNRSTRAVCFNVPDITRADSSPFQSCPYNVPLAVNSGSCKSYLVCTIIIYCASLDNCMNGVVISKGIFQSLQDNYASAASADYSLRILRESTAVPVG